MEILTTATSDNAVDDSRQELQDLLETIVQCLAGPNHGVSVFPASGKSFVHFEVRCQAEPLRKIRGLRDQILTVMYVASSARKLRTTVKLHEQSVHSAPPPSDTSETLENLVLTMCRALADRPEEVVVFPGHGEGFSHYDVRCESRDVGTLLGTRGAHVGAMRRILEASGDARGLRASLHIAARDGND